MTDLYRKANLVPQGSDIPVERTGAQSELELLRSENTRLAEVNREAFGYIRSKVDSLLGVIGTRGLNPEELDDRSLIEFDPIGIVAQTFQHILENLQTTNQKLNFAHEEIKTVFEAVGAGILVLDPQGRVVSYNQKIRDLMLGDEIDIHGKRCRDHVCGNNDEDDRCIFAWVMGNHCEQRFAGWNCNGRSFDVLGRPMFDEVGNITHVVLAYHDVSARKDAQSALLAALEETQETNAKINGILRSAADGILVTDAGGNVVLANRRAEELLDLPRAEVDSTSRIERISHVGLVNLLRLAPQRGQEIFSEDLDFQLDGHSPCICQARITVIKSSRDEFNGCITLLHDVTEQRAIDRMKDEFVSTAAHELRTPLATIIGYADLLQMENNFTPEQQTEYLQQIQNKAERLGEIVSDLLDISRIESGEGVKLDRQPNQLEKLCNEVVKSFRLQAPGHSFELDFPPSSVATVNVDRYAMLQILENLLNNAVKYSPAGGTIRISGQVENDRCLLVISDQGIGMTSEQAARVYDKFYRADATNTAISGTGLGMTIVKHLVEAHSGQVGITSSPGKGTTVTIALPVAAGQPVNAGR
jgi:two-component system phosphate regulon sensor histidine kinase PhoR